MRNNSKLSFLWVGALAFGLWLGAGHAVAETKAKKVPNAQKPVPPSDAPEGDIRAPDKGPDKGGKAPDKGPDKGGKASGKGQVGDACKTNADCDQASRPMRCVRSSEESGKCAAVLVHPVT